MSRGCCWAPGSWEADGRHLSRRALAGLHVGGIRLVRDVYVRSYPDLERKWQISTPRAAARPHGPLMVVSSSTAMRKDVS